jgi:hypothetical protein
MKFGSIQGEMSQIIMQSAAAIQHYILPLNEVQHKKQYEFVVRKAVKIFLPLFFVSFFCTKVLVLFFFFSLSLSIFCPTVLYQVT